MPTSHRARTLAALNHQASDRFPVDLSAHRSSGISAILYPRLRAALGLSARPVRVYDPVQQLAIVDEDVLDRLDIDTIELGRGFCQEDEWWRDWELPDGSPCQLPRWVDPVRSADGGWALTREGRRLGRMPAGALHFDQTYWPRLGEPELPLEESFASSMWHVYGAPPPAGLSDVELAAGARRLRASSDRCIVALFGGNLLETGQMLYRMDEFLMLLGAEPARAHEFLDQLVERHLARLERFLGAVGPSIDVIVFGDDLGAQNGPQISPRMYREFFQPRHAALWRRARQLAPVKVMLHCCGAVRPLLPLLIEAGLDAINPVQINCRGMEAEALKRDFGSDLTFWGGGCDTQRMLPSATPGEVRAHVLEQCRKLAPGGGFVFQQVHNIMANVPVENVLAMYAAAAEAGGPG
jgi:uroporphyrinogen decarboxylase